MVACAAVAASVAGAERVERATLDADEAGDDLVAHDAHAVIPITTPLAVPTTIAAADYSPRSRLRLHTMIVRRTVITPLRRLGPSTAVYTSA